MTKEEWENLDQKEQSEIMMKCAESTSYFYNNFIRKKDQPEITDEEFNKIRYTFYRRRGRNPFTEYPWTPEECFSRHFKIEKQ